MNYLIWANIYLAVFYGFYWFFLRKETFFQLNRGYLLSSALLSFILPLLDLKGYFFSLKAEQFFYTLNFEAQVNQVVVPSVDAGSNWMDSFSGISILTFIYAVGCLFSFIKLLYQGATIKRRLKYSYSRQAYSLFNFIRVDPDLFGYSTIVEHEKIHAKQFHSVDILFIELIKIVCWFNPLVYLLHRSIKLNHEYIADEISASSENDRTEYAQILLSQTFSTPIHSITNNFFNESFIKKRIIMLFKNKSKKLVLGRFFLLAPILVMIVAFQAKEPILSTVQGKDLEDNSIIEAFQTDTTGTLFTAVEVPPVPPSGSNAFSKWISDNYVLPKEAKEANVKGRVIVTFIVETDGQLSDIRVVRDLGYGTGEEATRVFKNSPKWEAGVQNGQKVRVQYTFPILIGQERKSEQESKTEAPTQPSASPAAQSSSESPRPVGGMSAFFKYFDSKYTFSEEAKEAGRISLSFYIEVDGSLSNIEVSPDLKSANEVEVIRILKAGPRWIPVIRDGKAVRTSYTFVTYYKENDSQ